MISFTEPSFFDSDKSQHSPSLLPHIFPWDILNVISSHYILCPYPLGLVSSVGANETTWACSWSQSKLQPATSKLLAVDQQ